MIESLICKLSKALCVSFVLLSGWWDETVAFIEAQVHSDLPNNIQILEDLKYLKELLLLFCQTVENYSLPAPRLKECAFSLRHHFVNKLYDAFLRRFIIILWREVYSPVAVTTKSLRDIRKVFPIDYIEAAKGKCFSGSNLPFSECVPKIYSTLKEFVTEVQSFCYGFNFESNVSCSRSDFH